MHQVPRPSGGRCHVACICTMRTLGNQSPDVGTEASYFRPSARTTVGCYAHSLSSSHRNMAAPLEESQILRLYQITRTKRKAYTCPGYPARTSTITPFLLLIAARWWLVFGTCDNTIYSLVSSPPPPARGILIPTTSVLGALLGSVFGCVGARHRPPGGALSLPSSWSPFRGRSSEPPLLPTPQVKNTHKNGRT